MVAAGASSSARRSGERRVSFPTPQQRPPLRPPAPRRRTARQATLWTRIWRPGHASHLVAAGQILGIGLICFAVWAFFDARQLYNNAVASPPGARRTVSMDLLGPISRVEEVFGVDRLVDGGNRALGRTPAPAIVPPVHPGHPHGTTRTSGAVTTTTTTLPRRPLAAALGLGAVLHAAWSPFGTSGPPPVVVPPKPSAPPMATPTVARPMTVLEIGDSLGVDLGYGLEDVLGNDTRLHLLTKAVIDTGLANTAYYNWPAEVVRYLRADHPGLVVVMLGGNDTQNFAVGTRVAQFGTPFWRRQYSSRVLEVMREATASGARVVWVGMPQMAPGAPVTSGEMAILDSVYAAAAAKVPGVLYLPTWRLLANSHGGYTTYLPDAAGALVAVRDPDGVHLDYPAGDDLVASAIEHAVLQAWKVRL